MKKTFTEQEVMIMLVKSHSKGENWGVTYSNWWTPTEVEKSEVCAKDCSDIINEFKNQ